MIGQEFYPDIINKYIMGKSELALSHEYHTNTRDVHNILRKREKYNEICRNN